LDRIAGLVPSMERVEYRNAILAADHRLASKARHAHARRHYLTVVH
jgi:hypothetical protein